ncbi:MAG: AAA family ATPase [Eubacteriaceae bacterium]|nr:AAA family ATPase [Eubacteriaceae bacterium]
MITFEGLRLTSFGKFKNFSTEFTDGINVVYGLNEAGKSTLHKFIEGMLFGFYKESRAKRIYSDDHEKYLPSAGSDYRGSLLYNSNGKRIRIERNLFKGSDDLKIYDDITGEDITTDHYYDNGIKLYFPMDPALLNRTLYNSTISISQLHSRPESSLADELKERLANFSFSGSDISLNRALQSLKKLLEENGTDKRKNTPFYEVSREIAALKSEKQESEKIYGELLKSIQVLNDLKEGIHQRKIRLTEIEDRILLFEKAAMNKKIADFDQILDEIKILNSEISKLNPKAYIPEGLLNRLTVTKSMADRLTTEGEKTLAEINALAEEIRGNKAEENPSGKSFDMDDLRDDYEKLFELREEKAYLKQRIAGINLRESNEQIKKSQKVLKNSYLTAVFSLLTSGAALLAGIISGTSFMYYTSGIFGVFMVYGIVKSVSLRSAIGEKRLESEEKTFTYKALSSEIDEIDKKTGGLFRKYGVSGFDGFSEFLKMAEELNQNEQSDVLKIIALEDRKSYLMKVLDEKKDELRILTNTLQSELKEYDLKNLDDLEDMIMKQDLKKAMEIKRNSLIKSLDLIMTKEEYLKKKSESGSGFDFADDLKQVPNAASEDLQELAAEAKKLDEEIRELCRKADILQGTILNTENSTRKPGDILSDLEYKLSIREKLTHKMNALNLAMEKINSISEEIHSEIAPDLNKSMSKVLKGITGKYDEVKVSKNMEIRVEDPVTEIMLNGQKLSNGTIDQLYLSLRLGIIDLLNLKEMPLIFDEAFLQYDDERLKNTLLCIQELSKERQIIIFTSQKRESRFFKELGIKTNEILLTQEG